MPHTATSIFRNRTANPPLGISLEDQRAVFCVSGRNTGAIIQRADVNKWAKYKYLRSNKLGDLTDADRKHLEHGLVTDRFNATGDPTTTSSFFYKLLMGTLPWEYQKPRGYHPNGSSIDEWYRPGDVDGYDTRATIPAYPFSLESVMLAYDDSLQIAFDEKRGGEDYELTLSDLRMGGVDIEDYYFGVLLYYSPSSYAFAATNQVGDGDLSVTFNSMASWAGKTVQLVPFLSTIPLNRDTAEAGGEYISFLGFEPVDVKITANSSGVFVEFDALVWNEDNDEVSYAISIRNTTNSAKSGLTLYIELWEGAPDPVRGQSVRSRTISNYSIGANDIDRSTCVGLFQNITRTPNVQYFVAINSLGDNVIERQAMPVEDYAERPQSI